MGKEAIKENLAFQRIGITVAWTGIIGVALLLFQLDKPRNGTVTVLALIMAAFLFLLLLGVIKHTKGEMALEKLEDEEK